MSITLYQMLASAMPWLAALLRSRRSRARVSHEPLDETDLAQRVRLTGEW